ncbi:hypothetical protein D3C76_1859730 [compost metagenome]
MLGFSDKGQELLKRMKTTSSLPVVTRAAGLDDPQLELDLRASAAYASAMPKREMSDLFRDYRQPPIRL